MQGSLLAACIFFMLTLIMMSCGPDSSHYELDGHFLNMNQGEFFIYSPDGAINRVDTAHVEGGRFNVTAECEREGTLLVIMPNGGEIPVFIKPGASVSIKGNAQHLKDVEIDGGEENALMSKFRKEIATANYPMIENKVMEYVKDNPTSLVSVYLIRRYLLGTEGSDYGKALKAIAVMRKADPKNESLKLMELDTKDLQNSDVGARLPEMHLTDIDGNNISNAKLCKGICVFATIVSYDYESLNQIKRIRENLKENNKTATVVGISIDASKKDCKKITDMLSKDPEEYIIVCDEKMTETPVAQQLSATQICTVVIAKDGKIVNRDLSGDQLFNYLKKL